MEYLLHVLTGLILVWPVVVNAQLTVPYISHNGVILANHGYFEFNDIGGGDSTTELNCHTDLTTCCRSTDGIHRGDWYYPNGTRLAFGDNSLNYLRRTQRVAMNRVGSVNSAAGGIYRCAIDTNAVQSMDNREVVYIGLYNNGGGLINIEGGAIEFEEFTGPDGETSHYVLTCITVGGPATFTNWTLNSEFYGHGETVLTDPETSRYTHTLTVQGRTEGEYLIDVYNTIRRDFTRITVTAPDSPTNLQVEQNGMTSVLVSWTHGNLTHPTATTGYTIRLVPAPPYNTTIVTRVVDSPSETSATVEGLIEKATYFVTIVANSNTLTSNVTGPENVTIETVEVSVMATPESPVMIGDTVSLSCLATIPPGVGGTPVYQLTGPSGGVLASENTTDIVSIGLDQAGRYTCTVLILFFNVSDTTNVTIQVVAPAPVIEGSRSPLLYEGTSYNLTCTSQLAPEAVASSTVEWRLNGNLVDTSPDHISIVDNILVFRPLTSSDTGSYVCSLILTANEYVVISNPQQQSPSSDLQVEVLPALSVTATTSDSQLNIGDQLDLECTVTPIPYLVIQPMLQWMMGNSSVPLATGSGLSLTHTLTVDRTSLAGTYSCEASIEMTDIGLSTSGQDQASFSIQLPQPSVMIIPDHTGTLYGGSTFSLTCRVTLNPVIVDTSVTDVAITWAGPRPIPGEWYEITDTVANQLEFTRNLSITPLADDRDDGEYTCSAMVTGGDYLLSADASQAFTVEVTSPPELTVSLATSGLLLTRQSYEFMCTSNVVDDLIPSFVLELLAPNGTSLAHNLSSTLSYTLPSLDASDGGTYTCKGVLVIAGSGINSTATAVKYITILDAYPVEDVVAINSKDTTGLEISWAPPSIGGDLTTDFTLTCTPLLVGIPVPDPMSTGSGEQLNISLTGLYPGVSYNCSVVAVTPEGRSTPETIVETTEETAPSGPPLSPHVIVGVTDVTFTWTLPEVTHRNGQITGFTLSCYFDSGSLAIQRTFVVPGTYSVLGFNPGTSYTCSLVAFNSKGDSPPAVIPLTTQTESTPERFNIIPVVAGVVAVVFIIAITVMVIVVIVFVARRRRHKTVNLNRGARPNSYIVRTADSQSATVRANPNTDEGNYSVVKAGAKGNGPVQEYEMTRTYSHLPPGKRPAPELPLDCFDVTANTHVTSEIDGMKGLVDNPQYQMLPGEINGAAASTTEPLSNPQYEMIEKYTQVGGASENVYEVPKGIDGGDDPVMRREASPYSEPNPRHNTMNHPPLTTYSVPRSRNFTITQGVPPSRNGPIAIYNEPRRRQNTGAQQPSLPLLPEQSARAAPNPYDHLGGDTTNTDPAKKPDSSPETKRPNSSKPPKK